MKNIRWGIAGLGRFGQIHAETIHSICGSQLIAVCGRNAERLAAFKQDFPETEVVSSVDDLIRRDDIDIISVTTHWQQHFEVAQAALTAGKHVFLEKPMATSSDECDTLVAIAQTSPGFLMVGHVCRFDPRIIPAKQAVDSGRIGRIVSMHAKRNLPIAPGSIRLDKISPLMGDGIHDADLMLWLMNRLPTQVYAQTIRVHNFQYPDIGWAMLSFDEQAIGIIETNWCLPSNVSTAIDARLEIVGTTGKISVNCADTGVEVLTSDGYQQPDTVYWPKQHGRRMGALAQELAYFAECVRNNVSPSIVTPAEAAAAVKVMEAAERSASEGRPIQIR